MKNFTKSILAVAMVASFISFAACGNSGAKTTAEAEAGDTVAVAVNDTICPVEADSTACCAGEEVAVNE